MLHVPTIFKLTNSAMILNFCRQIHLISSFVYSGGATVWPFAGVSVFPDKGDGILWYNLFRNKDPDIYTHHSACPVLLGTKWIGNKWIGYNSQWDTAKCSLSEEALFNYANV